MRRDIARKVAKERGLTADYADVTDWKYRKNEGDDDANKLIYLTVSLIQLDPRFDDRGALRDTLAFDRVIRVIRGQLLLLFLAEFLESGIAAQRVPERIKPKKGRRNRRWACKTVTLIGRL